MRSGAGSGGHHDDYFLESNRSPTPNKKHEFIKTVLNINDNDSEFSESCSPREKLHNEGACNTDLFGDFMSKRQQRLSNSMNIYDLYQCVHNLSPSNNNHQFIARRFSDSHIPSLHHRQQQQKVTTKTLYSPRRTFKGSPRTLRIQTRESSIYQTIISLLLLLHCLRLNRKRLYQESSLTETVHKITY